MNFFQKIHASRLVRFLLVGAGNSTINFAVLNIAYYGLRENRILSIALATTCAISFSFALNRSYVFRDKYRPMGKFIRFAVISSGGVLFIQTTVFTVCSLLLQHSISSSFFVINLSNLIASFVVMFWNYNGYRLLVFVGGGNTIERIEEGNVAEVKADETT